VRATPHTLASRRKVVAHRAPKKEQFAKHISALNKSFYKWLQEQVSNDASCDMTNGFQVRILRINLLGFFVFTILYVLLL
jgi:hypothetical protein